MGVLSCSRRGCSNIMCNRYSVEHGYICWECFGELVEKGIDEDIEGFMKSEKIEKESLPFINPYDYFNNIFPDQEYDNE